MITVLVPLLLIILLHEIVNDFEIKARKRIN